MNPPDSVPRVFISYSHDSPEHADRVLALADRLRAEGIDCDLDQYKISPPEGWPCWALNQVEAAEKAQSSLGSPTMPSLATPRSGPSFFTAGDQG